MHPPLLQREKDVDYLTESAMVRGRADPRHFGVARELLQKRKEVLAVRAVLVQVLCHGFASVGAHLFGDRCPRTFGWVLDVATITTPRLKKTPKSLRMMSASAMSVT